MAGGVSRLGAHEWIGRGWDEGRAPSRPRILSPVDGSVYFRDPRLVASAIRFDAEAPEACDLWLLDGRRIPATPPAAVPLWRPEPGDHRLQLCRGGVTAEIRFSVR